MDGFYALLNRLNGLQLDKDLIRQVEALDTGSLNTEIMDRVEDVVRRVRETGGKGSVTLKLTFTYNGGSELGIEPEVKSRTPKTKQPARIVFADEDNQLHGSDPNQIEMELREADEAEKGLRSVPKQDTVREAP